MDPTVLEDNKSLIDNLKGRNIEAIRVVDSRLGILIFDLPEINPEDPQTIITEYRALKQLFDSA